MDRLRGEPSASVGTTRCDLARELLQRTANADHAAFTQLFELFEPRVFWTAWRVIGVRSIAEDASQEVFVEIWRHASRYDPARGSAATWILTLAHRRAVDSVRKHQLSFDRDQRVGIRDLDPARDTVSEDAELRDEVQHVRAALRALSPKQQTYFVLAYYEGCTHTEIAAMTETPLGTVKSAIRSGLKALRRTLSEPAAVPLVPAHP